VSELARRRAKKHVPPREAVSRYARCPRSLLAARPCRGRVAQANKPWPPWCACGDLLLAERRGRTSSARPRGRRCIKIQDDAAVWFSLFYHCFSERAARPGCASSRPLDLNSLRTPGRRGGGETRPLLFPPCGCITSLLSGQCPGEEDHPLRGQLLELIEEGGFHILLRQGHSERTVPLAEQPQKGLAALRFERRPLQAEQRERVARERRGQVLDPLASHPVPREVEGAETPILPQPRRDALAALGAQVVPRQVELLEHLAGTRSDLTFPSHPVQS
jgi:hypothetical protein